VREFPPWHPADAWSRLHPSTLQRLREVSGSRRRSHPCVPPPRG